MEQIIKIEQPGTLNLPQKVIDPLELKKDDRLMVFSDKNGIVIKKVAAVALKDRFEKLAGEIEAQFKKQGVTEADVLKAVEWSRK